MWSVVACAPIYIIYIDNLSPVLFLFVIQAFIELAREQDSYRRRLAGEDYIQDEARRRADEQPPHQARNDREEQRV